MIKDAEKIDYDIKSTPLNKDESERLSKTIADYKKEMEDQFPQPNPELLLELVKMQMPFGKYKGTILCNLPVSYLEWFQREGFPKGKLGMLLATMYEIKSNGLQKLLDPLKR